MYLLEGDVYLLEGDVYLLEGDVYLKVPCAGSFGRRMMDSFSASRSRGWGDDVGDRSMSDIRDSR